MMSRGKVIFFDLVNMLMVIGESLGIFFRWVIEGFFLVDFGRGLIRKFDKFECFRGFVIFRGWYFDLGI